LGGRRFEPMIGDKWRNGIQLLLGFFRYICVYRLRIDTVRLHLCVLGSRQAASRVDGIRDLARVRSIERVAVGGYGGDSQGS